MRRLVIYYPNGSQPGAEIVKSHSLGGWGGIKRVIWDSEWKICTK